jgi:hypothetical protein
MSWAIRCPVGGLPSAGCRRLSTAQHFPHHSPVDASNFRDTPATVPAPNSNCRRICSTSSTFSLLASQLHFRLPYPRSVPNTLSGGPKLVATAGPDQTRMPQLSIPSKIKVPAPVEEYQMPYGGICTRLRPSAVSCVAKQLDRKGVVALYRKLTRPQCSACNDRISLEETC